MTARSALSPLHTKLAMVFFSMLAVMFVYEYAKQSAHPNITIWESHIITIVFTSIVAVILVFFPLRSAYREHQYAQDALLQQQQAEEKLRRSEIQYRSFVESVEDSIYTVDRDCRYLLINTRHLARRGLSPETYTGKSYGDFHTAQETAVFTTQVMQVLDTKNPVEDEYEQNGRHFVRKLNPVIDPVSYSVIAVTVISSDITATKKAQRELATINRKLNLVNDITRHDILNQLTALNSYLALAGEQTKDQTLQKYIVKGEQVIDTIQAQILFARDYQTIGIGSPQWQNPVMAIQRARVPLRLISLTIDPECQKNEIYADPLLEKVFYNLLENSVRHASPQPEIRITAQHRESELLLVYEDNGPGIIWEDKERIFERGFGSNSGFGLFLIREILAITDITISETGEFGKGCRFEILIPPGRYRAATGKTHDGDDPFAP